MRRSLTLLYLLSISILLAKQVRAPFPHPDVTEPEPEPEPEPAPVSNPSDSGFNSGDEGDDTIDGIPQEPVAPAPVAPVAPPADGNEAEFEEEDVDYGEILEHVSELLDAITSIISELDDGSSTTVSAPLPSAALPCYSVSSIYNDCGLHNSLFPSAIFPVQASCLCYHTRGNDTTATWAPNIYDGYMSSCNDYAHTQQQASITSIGNSSSVFNLCSSAGDVRATPALTAASSTTTASATPAAKTTTASTPTATGTSNSAKRMSIMKTLILCLGMWLFRLVI